MCVIVCACVRARVKFRGCLRTRGRGARRLGQQTLLTIAWAGGQVIEKARKGYVEADRMEQLLTAPSLGAPFLEKEMAGAKRARLRRPLPRPRRAPS